MRNSDDAIDRVLTALGTAEAPAGMKARILLAMEERAPRQTTRKPWSEWVWGGEYGLRLVAGTIASAVCVLAMVAVATRHKAHVASHAPNTSVTAHSGDFAGEKEVVSQRLKPHDDRRGSGTIKVVSISERGEGSSQVEGQVDYDSLAVSEMLAPSKPAPPLPLTRQEELLAEVVHKGDPEQVADLKPEVRAKEREVSKAEFHDFFQTEPVDGSE